MRRWGGYTLASQSNPFTTNVVSVTTADSAYTIPTTVDTVFYSTATGDAIAVLPAASLYSGRIVTVKKTSTLNELTIKAVSGNVETNAAATGIVVAAGALTSYSFQSDGTNWWIV